MLSSPFITPHIQGKIKIKMKLLCPLDQIWEVAHAHNWFASNLLATQLPTVEDMTQGLPNFNLLSASIFEEWRAAYRKVFKDTFEIQLSEQWWKDSAFLSIIHETLKHICGADYWVIFLAAPNII